MPYTRQQLLQALRDADAAKDTKAAARIAALLQQQAATAPSSTQSPTFSKPTADLSPLDIKPHILVGKGGNQIFLNKDEVEFGKNGVVRDSPGDGLFDLGDYARVFYYPANQEYARSWLGKQVKRRAGANSNYDPEDLAKVENGRLMYLDISQPKPRWKWMDQSALDLAGSPETVLKSLGELGGDVAAGAAGAFGGSLLSPLGGVAGGAMAQGTNAALWRYLALKKGKELGFNDGLDDEDLKKAAFGRGLVTAGTAGVAGAIPGWQQAGRLQDSAFFGKNSSGFADDVERGLAESSQVIADTRKIHERVPHANETFSPTVAQSSGVENVQRAEATLESGHLSKSGQRIAQEIADKKAANKRILTDIWDYLMPKKEIPADEARQAGIDLVQAAQESAFDTPLQKAQRSLAAAGRGAAREISKLPTDVKAADVLEAVRGTPGPTSKISGSKFFEMEDLLRTKQAELQAEVERRAKGKVWRTGPKGSSVEKGSEGVWIEFSNKNGLLRDLYSLKARLTQGTGSFKDSELAEVLDNFIDRLTNSSNPKFNKAHPLQISWDEFDGDYQKLGKRIGDRMAGRVTPSDTTPTVSELEEFKAILDKAIYSRNNTGPNGLADLIETWEQRKEVTRYIHDFFEGKTIRNLFKTANPEDMLPEAFVRDLFPTEGASFLKILITKAKGDPEAMTGLRSYLLKMYRNEVTPGGKAPSLDAHNRWIAQHKDQLELLFDGNIPPNLTSIGNFAKTIESVNQRDALLARAVQKKWYSIVTKDYKRGANVGDIFDDIAKLSERIKPEEIRQMVDFLGKTAPDSLALIRQNAINLQRVRAQAEGLPNGNYLMKLASNRKLTALLGEGYGKDLKTLAQAALITERTGRPFGQPSQSIVTEAIRTYAGPLSRLNRFITGTQRASSWVSSRRAYDVISDPERLHRALTYATMAPSEKAVPIAIMQDIGALGTIFYADKGTKEDERPD